MSAMKYSMILAAVLALGGALSPHAVLAQTSDQSTMAPAAGDTAAPGETTSPGPGMTTYPEATATPADMSSSTTTNTYPGGMASGSGYWGLLGLLGLFGLLGLRSRTTTL